MKTLDWPIFFFTYLYFWVEIIIKKDQELYSFWFSVEQYEIICIIQSLNFYWFCHPLNFDVYTHASHNQLFCVFLNIDIFVKKIFQIYLIQNSFLIYDIRRFLPFGEKSISNLDITLDYAKL